MFEIQMYTYMVVNEQNFMNYKKNSYFQKYLTTINLIILIIKIYFFRKSKVFLQIFFCSFFRLQFISMKHDFRNNYIYIFPNILIYENGYF